LHRDAWVKARIARGNISKNPNPADFFRSMLVENTSRAVPLASKII